MIRFEHIDVSGWEAAIRGMRNLKESWDRSDSKFVHGGYCEDKLGGSCNELCLNIGSNDLDLMKRLARAGSDHRKFMRYLTVTVDITAPLYWWKEFDTYKVGTVANSCSTMHCIHKHEFTLEDFSCEHLYNDSSKNEWFKDHMLDAIDGLNQARLLYLELDAQIRKGPATAEMCEQRKKYWWQMIQLLPSSYNQKRTVQMTYETLANIRRSRCGHKQDEWRIGIMEFIKSLPYHELIDIAAGVKTEEEKAEKDKIDHNYNKTFRQETTNGNSNNHADEETTSRAN